MQKSDVFLKILKPVSLLLAWLLLSFAMAIFLN